MKLTLHFKDGHAETVEDAMPTFTEGEDGESMLVSGMNKNCECVTDDVPMELLTRVVWEAE